MTSAKQVCEQLLADALEDGGSDNITILVGRAVQKTAAARDAGSARPSDAAAQIPVGQLHPARAGIGRYTREFAPRPACPTPRTIHIDLLLQNLPGRVAPRRLATRRTSTDRLHRSSSSPVPGGPRRPGTAPRTSSTRFPISPRGLPAGYDLYHFASQMIGAGVRHVDRCRSSRCKTSSPSGCVPTTRRLSTWLRAPPFPARSCTPVGLIFTSEYSRRDFLASFDYPEDPALRVALLGVGLRDSPRATAPPAARPSASHRTAPSSSTSAARSAARTSRPCSTPSPSAGQGITPTSCSCGSAGQFAEPTAHRPARPRATPSGTSPAFPTTGSRRSALPRTSSSFRPTSRDSAFPCWRRCAPAAPSSPPVPRRSRKSPAIAAVLVEAMDVAGTGPCAIASLLGRSRPPRRAPDRPDPPAPQASRGSRTARQTADAYQRALGAG